MSKQNACWLDKIQVPMNACSLETLYTPMMQHKYNNPNSTGSNTTCNNIDSNNCIYPLVIGCYQLNETVANLNNNQYVVEEDDQEEEHDETAKKEEEEENDDQPSRSGELLLYTIHDKDMKFDQDRVQTVNTVDGSGVLDGKWLQRGLDYGRQGQEYFYATANASGSIQIYKLEQCALDSSSSSSSSRCSSSSNSSGYQLRHVTASESDANAHGLALSLAWDESTNNLDNDDSNCSSGFERTRIISSYSKGSLALHDIHFKKYGIDDDDNDDDHYPSIQVEESQRWDAHTMFGCPSEVWTTCFASNRHYSTYSNSVLSGGDDCKMKLWDLRVCHKPMHVNDNFEAGVTVVSYHPFLEHIFAVGSYDEKIRICDMRKLGGGATAGMPLDCIHDVGGGVWRIKWNPLDGTRMLVGAMHGGCRVLQIEGMENANAAGVTLEDCVGINVRTVKEFREHQSMAYGADWILSNNPESGEAAASCSFYDKAAFIWSVE